MIAYRPQDSTIQTCDLIASVRALLQGAGDHSAAQELLIAYGELESALADAGVPQRPLREAASALGGFFESSSAESKRRFEQCFDVVERLPLPRSVRVSVPEGYAFYGLYPESYSKAARQFAFNERPQRVCVIGIRSIGTSLSAAVAGALLGQGVLVDTYTVRPDGHPFDREARLDDEARDAARAASHVAVVDEGPGLSGSSFIAVTRALSEAGIAHDRIVMFPSWLGDPDAFVNRRAREAWPRYRKYCADIEPPLPKIPLEDWSAGKWRDAMPAELRGYLPSYPQHEARKYHSRDGRLFKFAGLGRYGREKLGTAELLADAGFSPKPRAFSEGYLEFDFVPGTPCRRSDLNVDFIRDAADYLAFRARHCRVASRSVEFDSLLEMIATNAAETLGPEGGRCADRLARCRGEFESRPPIRVDGRMIPHEWITTAAGARIKTDSVDHCRDHFFPGAADPAWDLAGAMVEFRMNAEQRQHLLHRYTAASRDRIPPAIVEFYEIGYLAFRVGYTSIAGKAMQPEYAGLLEGALARNFRTRKVIA